MYHMNVLFYLFFFALFTGAVGFGSCPAFTIEDGEKRSQVFLSATDISSEGDSGKALAEFAADDSLAGRLRFKSVLVDQGVNIHYMISDAVHNIQGAGVGEFERIGFNLQKMESTESSVVSSEYRRLNRLSMDDFPGTIGAVRQTLKELQSTRMGRGNFVPKKTLFTKFSDAYHQTTQTTWGRAVVTVTGAQMFMFIHSITTLVKGRKAQAWTFDRFLAVAGLVPLSLGVVDDVIRAMDVVNWVWTKMSSLWSSLVAPRTYTGLLEATGLETFSTSDKLTMLRRAKMNELLSDFLNSMARTPLVNKWSEGITDALEYGSNSLKLFWSWIVDIGRSSPFALTLLHSQAAPLLDQLGGTMSSLGTLASAKLQGESHIFGAILSVGEHMKRVSAIFRKTTSLELDVATRRAAIGAEIDVLLKHVDTSVLKPLRALGPSLTDKFAAVVLPRFLNELALATHKLGDAIVPSVTRSLWSDPKLLLSLRGRTSTHFVKKISQFITRQSAKWGGKLGSMMSVFKRGMSWTKTFAVVKFRAFASKMGAFMTKALPVFAVLDITMSVYQFVEAVKLLDRALLEPELLEYAVTNMVVTSVFLVMSTINLGVVALLTLASWGVIGASVAVLSAILGVIAVVAVVFMIVSMLVMSYVETRRECRDKLTAFHYYATNLARQFDLFLNPTSPTTFSMLNTLEGIGTFPSYLVVDKLVVNSANYIPTLAPSFLDKLKDSGESLRVNYDWRPSEAMVGNLIEVVLPNNIYAEPGWHKCAAHYGSGCSGRIRRRLRQQHGYAPHSLKAALQQELQEFRQDPNKMAAKFHIPDDTPEDQVRKWMDIGYRILKHDPECEESTWLTYSEVHMPKMGHDTLRSISLIINTNSLILRTPIMPLPSTTVSGIRMQYRIALNGDRASQPDQSSVTVPLSYTLVIPGLQTNHANDLDYEYLLTKNTPRDMLLIIQFPGWLRADEALRWTGGVLDDIAAFCQPTVSHTWRSIDGATFNRTISLSSSAAAGGNNDNSVAFLVKRGHYQFGVDRKTKTYTLYAITPNDPSQNEYDEQVMTRANVTEKTLKRSNVVIAVLGVLRGYLMEARVAHNYHRDNLPVPVIFDDRAQHPTLYFNPLQSKSRHWSFFCARWHNETTQTDFRFDCPDDDMLPDHTMTEIDVTSRGLRVSYRFPELDDGTGDAHGSTVHILFPQEDAPQVTSVRCPTCTRKSVEVALESALAARSNQWDSTLTLAQSGLYIQHTRQSNVMTHFFHPSTVVDRYMPYNETNDVILGYFAMGDCFLLRSKLSSSVEAINLYRAAGVLHGNEDSSKQLVAVPTYNAGNHFVAAMKTIDQAACSGVQAVDKFLNVYCVSCLHTYLLEARTYISPISHPDFVAEYVDSAIPTKFFFQLGVTHYHGVLRFHGRVFLLPYDKSYLFVGLLRDFQCALFMRSPNDGTISRDATCVAYLEDDKVLSCTEGVSSSPCELRTTNFTVVQNNSHLDELHLRPVALTTVTFICRMHPKSRTLTLEQVKMPCPRRQMPNLSRMQLLFRYQITPSLYQCRRNRLSFYRGCRFHRNGSVRVISRDPVDDVASRASAGFLILNGVDLAQLETRNRRDRCFIELLRGVSIGHMLGMVSDLGQSGDLSMIALHKQLDSEEPELEFEVPCVAGFEMLKVTIDGTNEQNLLELNWACFTQYTENITVSIFVPSNIVLRGSTPNNPLVFVKIYNISSSDTTQQEKTRKDGNSNDGSHKLFSLQKRQHKKVTDVHDPLHAIRNNCGCTTTNEICVANGLCVNPSTILTAHHQQLLDPRFLTPENSELYCIWFAKRRHCHDKRLLYTILGNLLAELGTPSHGSTPADYAGLNTRDKTMGIVCFCITDACEEDLMRRILTEDQPLCNFFVRALILPEDTRILPNVFRAFRLWPDPDPLSARGRLNAARIELSVDFPCVNDRIARYMSFSNNGGAGSHGRVVQRISYRELVRGFCVQVTSSYAVLAQDEIPFPCPTCGTPSRNFSPYLKTFLAYLESDKPRVDVRVGDLINMCRSLLALALSVVRDNWSLASIRPMDFFASVYTDRAGYAYFNPIGGVSLYALERLEYGTPHLGTLQTILVSLLTPIIGNNWEIYANTRRPGVKESLHSLQAIVASIKLMDAGNGTSVDWVVEELENTLSEFPRLRACTLPLNAPYSAERYVATHKENYRVHANTIKVVTTEVFSLLELEVSDNLPEMLVDAACFQQLVTMLACDTQKSTTVELTVMYDGLRGNPILTETPTATPCAETCTDAQGLCQKYKFTYRCECLLCSSGYSLDHPATQHPCSGPHREMDAINIANIGGTRWFNISPLLTGPLYSRYYRAIDIASEQICCRNIRLRALNEDVACLLAVELIGADIFQLYTKDVTERYYARDHKYMLEDLIVGGNMRYWILSEHFGLDSSVELLRWPVDNWHQTFCPESESDSAVLLGITVECLGETAPVVPDVKLTCGVHGYRDTLGLRRANFPATTMRGFAFNHDEKALYAATDTSIRQIFPETNDAIFDDIHAQFRGLGSAGDALYVVDAASHVVLKLPFGGNIQVYAGQRGIRGTADGNRLMQAQFDEPQDIAVHFSDDDGVLVYVTEFTSQFFIRLRIIDPQEVVSSTALQVPAGPHKIASASNKFVYLSDTTRHCIFRIKSKADPFAGQCGDSGFADGAALGPARFFSPHSIAVDNSYGHVYIIDGNPGIRVIAKRGVVRTLAADRSNEVQLSMARARYLALDIANIYLSDDSPGSELGHVKLFPDDLDQDVRWCRTTRPLFQLLQADETVVATGATCESRCTGRNGCIAFWGARSICYLWWHPQDLDLLFENGDAYQSIGPVEAVPKFCNYKDPKCDSRRLLTAASTDKCRCGRGPTVMCNSSTELCEGSPSAPQCVPAPIVTIHELPCSTQAIGVWRMVLDMCIQERNGREWRFSCSPNVPHAIVLQQFESNSHHGPCSVPINAQITRRKGRPQKYYGVILTTQPDMSIPFWPYGVCGRTCDNRFRHRAQVGEMCTCGTTDCTAQDLCDAANNACVEPSLPVTFPFMIVEDSSGCTNSVLSVDASSVAYVTLDSCTPHPQRKDVFVQFTCVFGQVHKIRRRHFVWDAEHCPFDEDPCLQGRLERTWMYTNGGCRDSSQFSWPADICARQLL
eukprot:GEMP01000091.1.p1 GENE.GEMP01000091.1~~GEMP01000091.1.p1  ORF type:complete len:3138 (+),score=407.38 GEMP01000091.1:19-9432(+)